MRKKLRTVVVGILVVFLGAECGPKTHEPVEPDEAQGEIGEEGYDLEEVSLEPPPPEPPEVYIGPWKQKGDKPPPKLVKK